MTSRRIPVDVSWTPSSSSSLMPQQTVWNTMENDRPTLIKTTTYEYYGFALYLLSFLFYGVYLLWAYLPDDILHHFGITYYCSRYWALAIPAFLCVTLCYAYAFTFLLDIIRIPPLHSIHTIADEYSDVTGPVNGLYQNEEDGIAELQDIPIRIVNACLFEDV